MASTYVNDLRLEEIGTGDQSGTWGTSTNTNLELIGEAFSFGTEAITTNADTHTTTIADGATDPGRSMYLKYTGTLDSACTITIGPNTISKMWFIENGTSGSQNIIISQGSGANITIPPGDVKVVYSDGAGSGAAVVDAFASLSVVDLKVQDDLTVTDDVAIGGLATVGGTLGVTGIATFTDDIIIGDGKTIGSASDVDAMTIASNGQVTFTQTLIGTALDISGDIDVDGTTNLDVVDIDGALTQDGGAVFNEASADVDFRVESNGNTHMLFVDGGNNRVGIGTDSPSTLFSVIAADGVSDNDFVGVITNAEATDGRSFGLGINAGSNGSDIALNVNTHDAGANLMRLKGSGDCHFPSATAFGIGTDSANFTLDVNGSIGLGTTSTGQSLIQMVANPTNGANTIHFGDATSGSASYQGYINYAHDTNSLQFGNASAEKMRINASGCIGLGSTADRSLGTNITTTVTSGSAGSGFWLSTGDSSATSSKIISSTDGSVGDLLINQGSGVNGGSIRFSSNDSEKMRIQSNGLVAIGTTSAIQSDNKLTVAGGGTGAGNGICDMRNTTASTGSDTCGVLNLSKASTTTSSAARFMYFFCNNFGTNMGALAGNGSGSVAFVSTSDERLKENIQPIKNSLDKVLALNPVSFDWKENGEHREAGFVAQEVEKVLPEYVTTDGDEMETKGITGGMTYGYIAVLTKAIQEQQAQIKALQSEINLLKGE